MFDREISSLLQFVSCAAQLRIVISVPGCVGCPPDVTAIAWSPFARPGGTSTLNWNSPGATGPAKDTVAVTPPIEIAGSGDNVADCESDPFTTGTGPKPLA